MKQQEQSLRYEGSCSRKQEKASVALNAGRVNKSVWVQRGGIYVSYVEPGRHCWDFLFCFLFFNLSTVGTCLTILRTSVFVCMCVCVCV